MKRRTVALARRLRDNRTYTIKELARQLEVHSRTVRSWRASGLRPLEEQSKPLYFRGKAAKAFILKRASEAKQSLQPDEFYCPRCRSPRRSDPNAISVLDTGRKLGKKDYSLHVTGVCELCGCPLNRFTCYSRLNHAWRVLVLTTGERTRYGYSDATPNSMNEGNYRHE